MGDEIALLNDDAYRSVPEHRDDSRWIHRPQMDWNLVAKAQDPSSLQGHVLNGTRMILHRRANVPGLHGAVPTRILHPANPHIFAFARLAPTGNIVCVFNFSEQDQILPADWVESAGVTRWHDMLSDREVRLHDGHLVLLPYARVWLI
jgi:amylosucrase